MARFHDYPEELWVEIMSWLPPESLKRFKRVCKLWNVLIKALIGDPDFVAKHLRNTKNKSSSSSPNLRFRELYAVAGPMESRDGTYLLTVIDDDEDRDSLDRIPCLGGDEGFFESLSSRQYGEMFRVVSHCDGVVCFHSCVEIGEDYIFLMNPSIGEIKAVRHPIVYDEFEFEALGFGYDPPSDDYKIVAVMHGRSDPARVEVYSLRRDAWEGITCDPEYCFSLYDCYSVYSDGACYWLLTDGACGVVSFDFRDEVFREIPFPEDVDSEAIVLDKIVARNGSVALFSYPGFDDFVIKMWVLEFDSVGGGCWSWTTSVTVGPLSCVCYPLLFWRENLLVLKAKDSGAVITYDLRTGEVGDIYSERREEGSTTTTTRLVASTKSLVSVLKNRK